MATADSTTATPRLIVAKELAALERMTVCELRERYVNLFGETTQSRNRLWLVRRIAWRMQSLAFGGLSDRARQRANELADTSDLRVTAPRVRRASPEALERTKTVTGVVIAKSRVPLPGTVITRHYQGRLLQVKVLAYGFEFEGERFKSLSAVAKKITGAHWNGFRFFNLVGQGENQ